MWPLLLFSGKFCSAEHWTLVMYCLRLKSHRSLEGITKAVAYKLRLNEVLMVILWSLKLTAIDYENSRGSPWSVNLSTWAWRTLTMSSLNDLHCIKDDTSVTAPFSSMETTLTGMATVRPVRTAVLIISVSWIWKKERGRMRENMSQEVSRSSLFQRPECSGKPWSQG